jgi:hypothetical protein
MKRTLVIAALSLASVSAFAQNGQPQPSFNDNAPIASQAVRTTVVSDSATAAAPAPSFAG